MHNVKIVDYGDTSQIRLFSHSLESGYELEERKKSNLRNKTSVMNFKYDLALMHDSTFSDFISRSDYLTLKDFYDCSDVIKSDLTDTNKTKRAKQVVYELCKCNKWDWFCTFTFDQKEIDSTNYDLVVSKVGVWIQNVKSRKAPDLKYILVPEFHSDGEHYHFHGLFSDVSGLNFVDSGHVTPSGDKVFNLINYSFGFSYCVQVKFTDRISAYITKYITKDLLNRIKGKKRYLCSKGLNRKNVTNLLLSEEEKKQLVFNTDNILYTKTVSNSWNRINYIEYQKGD